MRKNFILSLCIGVFLCLILSEVTAQNDNFAQYFNRRSTFNPAMTGLYPCWTLTLNARQHWRNVQDYNTYGFTLEHQMPNQRIRWGLNAVRAEENSLGFVTSNIGGVIAVKLNENFYGGLAINWLWVGIDRNKLIFSDQIDNNTGTISTITNADNINLDANNQAILHPGASFGVWYSRDLLKTLHVGDWAFGAGIALRYFTQPHVDLVAGDAKDKKPVVLAIDGTVRHKFATGFYVNGNLRYALESFYNQEYERLGNATLGIQLDYQYNASKKDAGGIQAGLYYHYNGYENGVDRLMFIGGWNFGDKVWTSIDFGYDISVGGGVNTDMGSAYEISTKFNFGKAFCNYYGPHICPKF